MKILVAGISRSGSTALYNVVRLTYMHRGKAVYGSWFADYDPDRPESIHVVKCHEFSQKWADWADKIFTSRRDLREVFGSHVLRWNDYRDINKMSEYFLQFLDWHQKWAPLSAFEMDFRVWKNEPWFVVERVSQSLGLYYYSDSAIRIIDQMPNLPRGNETEPHHPITLLSFEHATNVKANIHKVQMYCDIANRQPFLTWQKNYGYV